HPPEDLVAGLPSLLRAIDRHILACANDSRRAGLVSRAARIGRGDFVSGSTWWKPSLTTQRSYPQKTHRPPASATRICLTRCFRRVTDSPTQRLHLQR